MEGGDCVAMWLTVGVGDGKLGRWRGESGSPFWYCVVVEEL